jgi:hypothetical protein
VRRNLICLVHVTRRKVERPWGVGLCAHLLLVLLPSRWVAQAQLLPPTAAATSKHLTATPAVSAISVMAVISATRLFRVVARAVVAPSLVTFPHAVSIPPGVIEPWPFDIARLLGTAS